MTSTANFCIFQKKTQASQIKMKSLKFQINPRLGILNGMKRWVNSNIDFFEMSYEEPVSYFKRLENLEKIRRTDSHNHSSLPIDNKKYFTSSVDKYSKNHKESNMWCHYYDKNNHNTADCRSMAKFKQHKKAFFEAKAVPRKKSLVISFLFKENNALRRQP
jgi:hypothetical protein